MAKTPREHARRRRRAAAEHAAGRSRRRRPPPRGPSMGAGGSPSVLDRVSAALYEQGIRGVDHGYVFAVVLELVEEEPHGVDPGALLVVALDRRPRSMVGVRILDH